MGRQRKPRHGPSKLAHRRKKEHLPNSEQVFRFLTARMRRSQEGHTVVPKTMERQAWELHNRNLLQLFWRGDSRLRARRTDLDGGE